jgi:hypothetical protein
MATLGPLTISPSSGKTPLLDVPSKTMQFVAGVADEGTDGEEAPAGGPGDQNLSKATGTHAHPDPDEVLVPLGFTIPPGSSAFAGTSSQPR